MSTRPVLSEGAMGARSWPVTTSPVFSIDMCKHLHKRVLLGDLKIDFPIHGKNPFKRKAVNEV